MLPPFDEFGYLPFGIHVCSIEELVARFGSGSPERDVQTQELLEFLAWVRTGRSQAMIVNGSYVTAKSNPNDVDIVILPASDYPRGEMTYGQQQLMWPFLQVFVAADQADLETWAYRTSEVIAICMRKASSRYCYD